MPVNLCNVSQTCNLFLLNNFKLFYKKAVFWNVRQIGYHIRIIGLNDIIPNKKKGLNETFIFATLRAKYKYYSLKIC